MPGIIAGIGMFWAMLLLPFAHVLQGTIWLLMLAFTMRGIPMAFGALSPTLHQIGRELDQGARSVGADWWTTVRLIILPLMKPALFSAYVLLFLAFLKEYAAAVFLFAPGAEIIGTTMLTFWTKWQHGTGRRTLRHPARHHGPVRDAGAPQLEDQQRCLRLSSIV
jgi:iron(III) transport system permease protein